MEEGVGVVGIVVGGGAAAGEEEVRVGISAGGGGGQGAEEDGGEPAGGVEGDWGRGRPCVFLFLGGMERVIMLSKKRSSRWPAFYCHVSSYLNLTRHLVAQRVRPSLHDPEQGAAHHRHRLARLHICILGVGFVSGVV